MRRPSLHHAIALSGGFIDCMQLLNARDGGVNGVQLTWSESAAKYADEKGITIRDCAAEAEL